MTQSSPLLPARFLRNLFSNYLARLAAIGIAFLMTPFVLGKLGAAAFGIWVLITSLVGYGGLLDLGVSGAVVKYVSELRASSDYEGANRLIATALSLYTVLALLFTAVAVLLAYAVPRVFEVPDVYRADVPWVVLVAGLGIAVALPCTTATGVLRAMHRFDVTNAIGIVGTLGSALAVIVVLSLGGGLLGLAIVAAVGPPLLQVPTVIAVRRVDPRVRIGWKAASRKELKRIFTFSWSVAIVQFSGMLVNRTDPVVIATFLRVAAITPYALAQRLSQIVYMLTTEIVKVLFPFASERSAAGDSAALRRVFLAGSRVTLAVSLPLTIYLAAFGSALLTVWVGAEYAEYGSIVTILAVNFMLDTASYSGTGVLMATNRHRPISWMAMIDGLMNVALSIVLVHPFGLLGVAVATVISTIGVLTLFVIPYTLRTLETTYAHLFRAVLLPLAVPALVYLGLLLFLRSTLGGTSLLAAGLGLVAAAVYVTLYIRFGASQGERSVYFQYAASAAHRLKALRQ